MALGDLFSNIDLLMRWMHVIAGITWIGHLYFFNFVNVPLQAALDDAGKKAVNPKLLPRALWWFRWGAMLTFLAGLWLFTQLYMYTPGVGFGPSNLMTDAAGITDRAWWIMLGMLLGTYFRLPTVALIEGDQLRIAFAEAVATFGLAGAALVAVFRWLTGASWPEAAVQAVTLAAIATLSSPVAVDAVVDRILDDTGLLAWAASETLGEGRAGVLMRLVEELRAGGEARGGALAREQRETRVAGLEQKGNKNSKRGACKI